MNVNKPVQLLLVFLAFSSFANAQDAVLVNKSEGDPGSFLIDEITSIVFSDDNYQIKGSDGASTEFMYDETLSLKFGEWIEPVDTSTVSVDLEENNLLSLYPNPVNNTLFFNMQTQRTQNLSVEIIDIKGKIVYQSINLKSNTQESIDIGHLQQGLYFCRIQNGKTVLTQKIIKN